MKKRARVWLSIFGAVALIAGAAAAAYQLNDTVKDWVDSEIGKIIPSTSGSTDSDAPAETLSSGPLSAKIYGGTVFGAGGKLESLQAGATKTVVFTVAPANATDKYVVVASSDTSKVTISPAKVLSGSPVTLTLVVGYFSGVVDITAKPEAMPSAVLTVPLTAYNAVTGLNLIEMDLADDLYATCGAFEDGCTFSTIWAATSTFRSQSSPFACCDWDSTTKTVTWSFDGFTSLYMTLVFEVTARDSSSVPSAIEGPAGTQFDKFSFVDGHYYLLWYGNAHTTEGFASVAADKTITFEEATYTFHTGAYVAPTGITADSGSVVFD